MKNKHKFIKIIGPQGLNGANGNAYYISIWTKVTQVSDVAHGPLAMLL
jgi:hypothetical protein